MPKPSIIDVARHKDGRLTAAATDRGANSLWQFDGKAWNQLTQWRGKEITACCAVGDSVVCPALDGALYAYSSGELSTHSLPSQTMWMYAAAPLDESRALLGGSEGLVFFDPATSELVHRRLSTYEISKPGRTIHGICRSQGRTFVVGAKNLLLEMQGETPVEFANRAIFAGRELLLVHAAVWRNRIWLSGHGVVAALDDSGLEVFEDPFGNRNTAIGLRNYGDELLAFQTEIYIGGSPSWRPLALGFKSEGLIAVEPTVNDQLCAVAHSGEAYLIRAEAVQSVHSILG